MVKNPIANTEGAGSIPDPGRSHMPWSNKAHVPQLLSLCSRARALQQEKPCQWEAWALQLENSPHLLQLDKRLCSNEDPKQP